jgi:sarcosine oxidase subunit alpha
VEIVDSRKGVSVTKAIGGLGVKQVVLSDARKLECDLLLMSGGWSPVVHLFSQSGGSLRYDEKIAAFVPDSSRQNVECVGSAAGEMDDLQIEPLWETPGKGKKFVDFALRHRKITDRSNTSNVIQRWVWAPIRAKRRTSMA